MLADLVTTIHVLFILWMCYVPFSSDMQQVGLHAILCVFLLGHWILGSKVCALTMLEKKLRGLSQDEESFIHSIVGPVYDVPDHCLKLAVRWVTVCLLLVSLYRLKAVRWAPYTQAYGDIKQKLFSKM